MAADSVLKDSSGEDLLMCDEAKFCEGSYSGFFSGATSREWKRAQAREKRRQVAKDQQHQATTAAVNAGKPAKPKGKRK